MVMVVYMAMVAYSYGRIYGHGRIYTSVAKTEVKPSIFRGAMSMRSATRRISGSKVGMNVSIASMKVT